MQQHIGSIEFELLRKPIKHMRINVLPPDGQVQVIAPNSFTDTAIRVAFAARIPWIKKQQQTFKQQARQTGRQWVSGECHYLWGKAYRLAVIEHSGAHQVQFGKDNFYSCGCGPALKQTIERKCCTVFTVKNSAKKSQSYLINGCRA